MTNKKVLTLKENAQESLNYITKVVRDNNLYSDPVMFRIGDLQDMIDSIKFNNPDKTKNSPANSFIYAINMKTRNVIKCKVNDFAILYGLTIDEVLEAKEDSKIILGKFLIQDVNTDFDFEGFQLMQS